MVPANTVLISSWWIWIFVIVAVAAAGTALVLFRRTRAQDATIRRQLAREVLLKARLDDLFERSSEIMVVHDRRGRVSSINRSGEEAIGYLRDELRTLDPGGIFAAEYLDAINAMIAEGPESAARTFRSEFMPRKGHKVLVEVQARVQVGEGQVVGVTSIARNHTERDRLESELRQAHKMEAVGRLASGIAHDFNNLITVLFGYSDELIEESPPGTRLHAAAVEVRRAADSASALTQQLLSFSRRQAAVASHVDVNQVIAGMEDLMRRLIGPEIRLALSLQPELAAINGDSQQLGQVLMNLVVNARDAMPEGGTIRIETENAELGNEHLDVIPGPHVSVAVSDTGVGMTAEVRERLFEPFFTTKESGRGTGLGLSMAQAIVRQAGGNITVESAAGGGSTFRLYFPRHAEASAATAAQVATSPPATIKGEGVVLLAEDDRAVRRLVVTELGRRGFTVLEAEDGLSALDLFSREKDRIDVLVTDVVMPRMNGGELAKQAERLSPRVKVLFVSGHPERSGAGVDPTGATNLLMKPFTADTLATRIKELIASKDAMDGRIA